MRGSSGSKKCASSGSPMAPSRIEKIVIPIWTVEMKRTGSSMSRRAIAAERLPSLASSCRRARRAVTSAYSATTKYAFPRTSRSTTRMIRSPSLTPRLAGRDVLGGSSPSTVRGEYSHAARRAHRTRRRTYVLYCGACRAVAYLEDTCKTALNRVPDESRAAVSLDGQPLPRLRAQLPLLLRPRLSRLPRSRDRRGLLVEDRRQDERRRRAPPRARVAALDGRAGRDGYRDRSLPALRGPLPADPGSRRRARRRRATRSRS